MKPKRSFVLWLALLSVALLALLVWTIPTKYSRRSQRLPDGSSLKIVSISYGTNHTFAMPHRKAAENFLVTHFPRSWIAFLGWDMTSGRIGLSPRTGEKSLVVFTLCQPAKPDSSSGLSKVVLCDERGIVYDSAFEGAVLGGFRGKHHWTVVGWQFSKFPHDSRYLRLNFFEGSADVNTQQPLAQFLIPNPLVSGATNASR